MVPKFPVHPEDPIYMGAEFLIMPLYPSRQAQTNLARQLGKEGKIDEAIAICGQWKPFCRGKVKSQDPVAATVLVVR